MDKFYTIERNVQIVIALLKAHGARKIIASPGTTNITLVASLQQDPFFELFSAPDERSAAYMACGLAAESGEIVALSCTGATASRNYLPGLTEAYYRKLPVLAITSTQHVAKIGHNIPQVIDRRSAPDDTVRLSVQLPTIHTPEDEWACEVLANRAILELTRHGGGPVHMNLATTYKQDYSVKELPPARVIYRIGSKDSYPEIPVGKVAVFIGSHKPLSEDLTQLVDAFCEANNAVVFCDHTSNYWGKYRLLYSLACCQLEGSISKYRPDLLIHIGEVSGAYPLSKIAGEAEVWRVSPDGEVCDTFQRLKYVFEMEEKEFLVHYSGSGRAVDKSYFAICRNYLLRLQQSIPEIPFSNIWIASRLAAQIPHGSAIHFGILNSLRSWNLFELHNSIRGFSNTGGFGIDGGLSSLIGASFCHRDKLYFGIFGDLAFFYDMNSLGNRHLGCNIRILLINNGKGTEFRNFNHPGSKFGEEADNFIAAGGHYGNKSHTLVRHYAEDLGFEYLSASSKDEFEAVCSRFVVPQLTQKPMLFEIFTDAQCESDALEKVMYIEKPEEHFTKTIAKRILTPKGINVIKKMLGREDQ